MAQQLGTSRETVSRILSDLKHKNIISVKGSLLVILKLSELQRKTNT